MMQFIKTNPLARNGIHFGELLLVVVVVVFKVRGPQLNDQSVWRVIVLAPPLYSVSLLGSPRLREPVQGIALKSNK